jgi:ribose 5-phosphate isomerase B
MTANKVRGVRAVVAAVELQARLARAHNDANVLCIGQRLTTPTVAERLLEEFLQAEFEGGRHRARVAKIENT